MMIRDATATLPTDVPEGFWASLCIAAGQAAFWPLYAMWALMAAAMMLPTFVPTFRTYLNLRFTGAASPASAAALVAGYGVVWLVGAALGAGAQWWLSQNGLVSPLGQSLSGWLTAALLLVAGLYQFSLLKAACLSKCRMPLTYFMERWKPGVPRALRMGVELGLVCFGCCWALMTLGFVGGTMNLLWMGAATLFMVLEKLPDLGRPLTRPAGWGLIAAAGYSALQAAQLI